MVNYDEEILLIGQIAKKIKTSITDGSEWDVVLSKKLNEAIPFVLAEMKKAKEYQDASTKKDFETTFPVYLRPYLKATAIKQQWSKLSRFDKSDFSHVEAIKAINSLTAIYFLSLCFFFLYLRSDADVENSKNFQASREFTSLSKLFPAFFEALETFEKGGELYDSLKAVNPKGKNLDVEMTFNDCAFFNTVACRLAFAFVSFNDSKSK